MFCFGFEFWWGTAGKPPLAKRGNAPQRQASTCRQILGLCKTAGVHLQTNGDLELSRYVQSKNPNLSPVPHSAIGFVGKLEIHLLRGNINVFDLNSHLFTE